MSGATSPLSSMPLWYAPGEWYLFLYIDALPDRFLCPYARITGQFLRQVEVSSTEYPYMSYACFSFVVAYVPRYDFWNIRVSVRLLSSVNLSFPFSVDIPVIIVALHIH